MPLATNITLSLGQELESVVDQTWSLMSFGFSNLREVYINLKCYYELFGGLRRSASMNAIVANTVRTLVTKSSYTFNTKEQE